MSTNPQGPLFKKVVIIGVGLIGSSLAHNIRKHGLAGEVVGVSRSAENREKISLSFTFTPIFMAQGSNQPRRGRGPTPQTNADSGNRFAPVRRARR